MGRCLLNRGRIPGRPVTALAKSASAAPARPAAYAKRYAHKVDDLTSAYSLITL